MSIVEEKNFGIGGARRMYAACPVYNPIHMPCSELSKDICYVGTIEHSKLIDLSR